LKDRPPPGVALGSNATKTGVAWGYGDLYWMPYGDSGAQIETRFTSKFAFFFIGQRSESFCSVPPALQVQIRKRIASEEKKRWAKRSVS
jgi:hypothetical protein